MKEFLGNPMALFHRKRTAIVLCLLGFSPVVVHPQQPFLSDGPPPMDMTVAYEPQLLYRGDTGILVYELIAANPFSIELRYLGLDITSGDGKTVVEMDGRQLAELAQRLPAHTEDDVPVKNSLRLMPGERYLLYFWLEFEPGTKLPASITHRFLIETGGTGRSMTWESQGPTVDVRRDVITIDSPVSGTWLVGNGFEQPSNHRNYYIVNQDLLIPQRFGADFLKLDLDGANAQGDGSANTHYFAFEEPVFAVADGEVIHVKDDMADLVPGESTRTRFDWNEYAGNYLLLKVSPRHYALYAHLQMGSFKVKAGDQVKRGMELARLGNTGNTMNPHLHFHMSEKPLPDESQGMPFQFRSFERLVENYRFRPDQHPLPNSGIKFQNSIPANRWVIRFPDVE